MKNKIIVLLEELLDTKHQTERTNLGERLIEALEKLDSSIGNPPFESWVKNKIMTNIRRFSGNPELFEERNLRSNLKTVLVLLSE